MWVPPARVDRAQPARPSALVKRYGTDRCAFCTDDREPDFIVEEGHINQMVRVAVEEGIKPEDALVMATINPATCHRLWRLGAIAPGYQADILVLDDLKSFRPREVLKRGATPRFVKLEAPEWVRQTVSILPVDASSFRVPAGPRKIRSCDPRAVLTGVGSRAGFATGSSSPTRRVTWCRSRCSPDHTTQAAWASASRRTSG
jgi:adenine deaminase